MPLRWSDNLRKTIALVIHSVDPSLFGQLILLGKEGNDNCNESTRHPAVGGTSLSR